MTAAAQPQKTARWLDALVALIADLEPKPGEDAIRAAVLVAAPGPRGQWWLHRELAADPAQLTTGSATVGRAVCRLALALVDAGAHRVVAPRCPRCGRATVLTKPTPAGRICAVCDGRERSAPCSRCGHERHIATRDPEGRPICSSCRARDPRNHEPCSRCGRLAAVNARTEDGEPVCGRCYEPPSELCDCCGQVGPVGSRTGDEVVCRRCYRHPRRRCGCCGRVRRIAVRARDGQPDLCPACHWAPTGPCTRCGQRAMGFGVRQGGLVCLRCQAGDRLDELLAGPDGTIPAVLAPLRDAFLAADNPRSVHVWLSRSPGRHLLRRLAHGELELSHSALDALPQKAALNHLRALLVAVGVLPERDAELARLERAAQKLVDGLAHPDDRRLLRGFATWAVLHRLRRRARRNPVGTYSAKEARTRIATAARLLAHLRHRGHALDQATQAELDHWIAQHPNDNRQLPAFLAWAAERHLAPTELDIPSRVKSASPGAADAEDRWALARRLLHDQDLDPGDRVAGSLVVLYAQPVSRIARLRRQDVTERDHQVLLRLGHARVLMPEPLGGLIGRLPVRRQIGPSGTVSGANQWLFPGRQAGQPQHPEYLRRRLGAIGVDCRPVRNAALLQLAAELPAAILADTLGLHPTTAVRWIKTAGGDWTRYAAQRMRTTPTATRPGQ